MRGAQLNGSAWRLHKLTLQCRHGAGQRTNSAKAAAQALTFRTGSCSLPHPDKLDTGGEDAFFVSADSRAFGIADGVGGWRESGIDPGNYSRTLMRTACDYFDNEVPGKQPADNKEWEEVVREALRVAHSTTRMPGSSTACLLALNAKENYVSAIHLGDSGFIHVRNGTVVTQSAPLQHFFDCPLQLGAHPEYVEATDYPSDAKAFTCNVVPGDVIVMATDGLWDNATVDEIIQMLPDTDEAVESAAEVIATAAREHAEDDNYDSPYIQAARKEGMDLPWWEKLTSATIKDGTVEFGQLTGGKLDDITVLVARVSNAPPPSQSDSSQNGSSSSGYDEEQRSGALTASSAES